MVIAKKWIYANAFEGEPKLSDFELEEEELPELKHGEILVEAEFLSVDPYMRPYMVDFPVGSVMIGGQVAKILESKNDNFPKDSFIYGHLGWRTKTVFDPEAKDQFLPTYILPDIGDLSRSLGIGALGMPGNTAYFGFLEICQPKKGETVVVSGAAGAVGSLVGQIAKIKGGNVIGIAGTDRKCDWLKELGFDTAINYKTANISDELKKGAPNGVDCYFDNVGGEISSTILKQMNTFGRISVCGTISNYNTGEQKVDDPQRIFNWKQLKQEGFIVERWSDRWFEGIAQIKEWVHEGKIKIHETITEGFENMPNAFMDMLKGANTGKAVVKV